MKSINQIFGLRWLCLFAVLLISIPVWADSAPGKRIAYRRVYAPVDRLADWPRGKGLYKPMDATAFERWASGESIQNESPQVTDAQFSAILEDDDQLTGEMALQIDSPSTELQVLPLSPCEVALADLEWEQHGERIPAQIGSDVQGRLFLFVSGSGTLRGRWSVRGKPDRAGQLEFQFLLPPSITKKIQLDLPEGVEPDLTDAVVSSPAIVSGDLRRWDLQLPGRSRIHLRILRPSADPEDGRFNLLKQSLSYEFGIERMQLDQELSLNVYRKPLKQLALVMDPQLRLIDAFLGDQPIEWLEQEEVIAGGRKIVLLFPEPVVGSDRVVRLRAMVEPVYDVNWKLPRMTPEGFSWQEGTTTLLVAAPLVIERMQLTGCQQLRAGKVPGQVGSEIFEIQDHGPDAEAEILLVAGAIQGDVDSVTAYTFAEGVIDGRMVCDVRLAGPAQFKIQAKVHDAWDIESVLSRDAGVIERWRQEATPSGNLLTIFLRRGISAARPLRLEITGRKNRTVPAEIIDAKKLQMLHFEGMRSRRQLFELVARDPYRVRIASIAAFQGFSFTELTEDDRDRVGEDFSIKLRGVGQDRALDKLVGGDSKNPEQEKFGVRFWYDSSEMDQMKILIEKPTPRFSTETRIEAQVGDVNISEQFVVECTPQESGIDSMQIVFSEKRSKPILCSVVDQNGIVLDGVRASRIPPGAVADSGAGETWMVRWNRPLSEKFQLIVNRTTRFDERTDIALIGVPQAAEQRATVAVLGGLGHHIAVMNRGLKALPVEECSHYTRNPMRARFRYDPERDVRENSDRGLNLARRYAAFGSALIWQAVAESWFTPTGEGMHRLTYYLENEDRGFFTAALEQGIRFQSAEVDGVQVRLPPAETNLPLTIALPENQRFSVVELQWNTSSAEGWLPWIRQVPLPSPEIDISVIQSKRIIHAPPGFVTTDSLSGVGADRVGLSWQQRLFGPLARLNSVSIFDPFDSSTWSNVPLMTVDDTWRGRAKAEKILEEIGRVLADNSQTAAWGDFTQNEETFTLADESGAMTVFVDLDALATVGIGPHTPIQVYANRSPQRLAVEALRKANLVVGFNADSWILSTVQSLQPTDSAWIIDGVVCRLDERNSQFADRTAFNPSAVPIGKWRDENAAADFPWKAVWRDGFYFTENQGGSTLYLEGSQADLSVVQLVDVQSLRGLQWTLFTVVALAGCLWGPTGVRKGVLCLLCLAIAALILPAMIAPLATAVFCAAGVAFLWQRFYPLSQRHLTGVKDPNRSRSGEIGAITRSMRFTRSEMLLLFLSAVLFSTGFPVIRSQAAPQDDTSPVVVIPVDEENKTVGDTYYLSATLFDGVHQDAAVEQGPLDWLLTAAQYRLEFDWIDDRSQLTVEYGVAALQIEVLGRHATVELPLGSKDLDTSECQLMVDGKVPRDLRRSDKGFFSFVLEEPGIYLVDIQFPIQVDEVGGMRRLDCPIPSLVTSQLEIAFPAEASPPEVLSAKGSVEEDKVHNRLQVQLGDVDRITLQWQEDETIASSGLADVDQLVWMKVQPGAVIVDARFKLNIEDRRIQRVRIVTDSQLRLLSPLQAKADGKDIELTHLRTVPGDPQEIELQWNIGITGEIEIHIPFLWAGVSGVGNIRLPEIEVEGTREYRRWVAVSIDPTLFVDRDSISQDRFLKPLSITAATKMWDLSNQSPEFFFQQTGSGVDWVLPTRLQESETVAFEKLAVGISDTVSEVIAEYEMETTDGHRCQYQIELPSGFVADRVEMLTDNVDSIMRWSVHEESGIDRLTLFLAEAVRGSQRLIIRGHLSHPQNIVEIPHFILKDVGMRGGQVALYRRPTVQFQLEGAPDAWQKVNDFVPMGEIPSDFGRFVGVYTLPLDTSHQRVIVGSNQIDAEAIQVVSLNRIDAQWNVEVDLRLKVLSGQLDTIRFRIPEEYQGPFQIDPELPFTVKELPAGEGFVFEIRPPKAITDSIRLMLLGTLNIAPEDPVRCPTISIEGINRVSQFVVLPKKVDFQDVSWKTTGLVRQALPEDSQNAPLADMSVASFEAVDHSYRAVLQSVGQPAQDSEVQFADIDIRCSRADRYFGRAVFDLDPAGLSSVGVQFPHESADLLRVRVSDRPTTLQKNNEGWDIELHSRNLIQRVEVLYSAPYVKDGSLLGVSRPYLTTSGEKIPIAHTLWSLANSHQSGALPMDKDQSLAIRGPTMQYEYLQKRTRNLLNALSDITSAEPVDVLLPWYTRAARHLISAQREMEGLLSRIPAESLPEFTSRQKVLAEKVIELATQLVNQGVFTSIEAFGQIGTLGPDPWQGFFSRPATLAGSESDQATVFLGRPSDHSSSVPFRWLLAGLVTGALAFVGFRPQVTESWLRRSFPLLPILFAIALFYWLFLSPSFIGFLAMLATGVFALVLPWKWVVCEAPRAAKQSEA